MSRRTEPAPTARGEGDGPLLLRGLIKRTVPDAVFISTAGWKPRASLGIYRSADGGATWQQVSSFGPTGQALVASDGDLLAADLGRHGRSKSTDRGKPGTKSPGRSRTYRKTARGEGDSPLFFQGTEKRGQSPAVSAGGWQAWPGSKSWCRPTAGAWSPLGPKLPFPPSRIVYSARGRPSTPGTWPTT